MRRPGIATTPKDPIYQTLSKSRKRRAAPICTLNVNGISNKLPAIQKYVDDHQISIIIRTATHIQGGGYGNMDINGMTKVSTCCRKAGQTKGGAAANNRDAAPCYCDFSRIMQEKNELEHCAAAVFANRNPQDRMQVVGVYRPPGRGHPPYTEAMETILKANKALNITTLILGDFNINTWEQRKKGYVTTGSKKDNCGSFQIRRWPHTAREPLPVECYM